MTHDLWTSLNGRIFEYLEGVNLAQLAAQQQGAKPVVFAHKHG